MLAKTKHKGIKNWFQEFFQENDARKKRPLWDVNQKKKWPLIFLLQDQGSSIVDGLNHLRNLLLSVDLFLGEFT